MTPQKGLIDAPNDVLELVEQIAHPLANTRGNIGLPDIFHQIREISLHSRVLAHLLFILYL